MRIRAGAAVLAVTASLALAACGSDGGERSGDDGTTTAAATSTTTPPDPGPGTALADGLVVPEGATLAGLFRLPAGYQTSGLAPDDPDPADGTDWTALLTVDGDPFAAFDDLAAQLRDGASPVPMPGTADACLWERPQPDPSDPGVGDPVAVEPRTEAEADARQAAYEREERERLEAGFVTAQAPDDVVGVTCSAGGWSPDADGAGQRQVFLGLRSTTTVPATLTVLVQRGLARRDRPMATSAVTDGLQQLQGVEREERDPRPAAAPPGTADALPAAAPQPDAGTGDEFGVEVNCFDDGYLRFRLPEGARLVADGFDDGTTSVLAIEGDLEAVGDDLARQASGPDPSTDMEVEVAPIDLGDGAVYAASFVVQAGGGGCSLLGSPDGTRLRIQRNSD